ncbi:fumarylacetoacetate hydrolase [Actinobacteria bacterium YIM 96077]|uniref:Fumarylacetoacetate hydrolase n=1 Tax=Phytoactinopolyspora halophila TaxID=1981511 RepID=A0A329QE58_9ACTN|nr:fumarylacetoacetate hydrolase family protein [Phytoactinopolyspora halophila]AYY12682.1 fumarylacetoacetate hydrolase [Actinobacteria bacterium YIM 96077]RAW10596.1 fumarylacetoacetate hydrolase [Phytoactinopolyspora halophila]
MATAGMLPDDAASATLVGRVWDTETGGPRPVLVSGDDVVDLFHVAPTTSQLLETVDAADTASIRDIGSARRWRLTDLVDASLARDHDRPHLLAPVDLQVVKACGVTFVDSMIERVIEERCAGDPGRAAELRERVGGVLHDEIGAVVPGSPAAEEIKEVLVREGMWSQYLEVGLGPDPEVFTKAPVLSSVGYGAGIGVPQFSSWNNPEPELVLIVDSRGRARGCTLGNDVNLRDVEGRSALLLGMAKDNNASSAIGPLIRLFDESFTVDTAREERITLRVDGADDGYVLEGENSVGRLSRPFEQLIDATYGPHHQYPDGFALYTGTLFAPVQDRDTPGMGFTHKHGDRVSIHSTHLGTLVNEVADTASLPQWTFGIRALTEYLTTRTVMARNPETCQRDGSRSREEP